MTRHGCLATLVRRVSRASAIVGGAIIGLLSVLLVCGVVVREVFGYPAAGDFEIVAVGVAVSVFLCLPWCQLTRGHLVVDFFLARAPAGVRHACDAVAAGMLGLASLVLALRMAIGLRDAWHYHDVSVILGMPYWWVYPIAIFSFALLAAVCAITARDDER